MRSLRGHDVIKARKDVVPPRRHVDRTDDGCGPSEEGRDLDEEEYDPTDDGCDQGQRSMAVAVRDRSDTSP